MPTYRSILVAEDDPQDAFLLRRAFAQAGVDVRMDFVGDGEEAIHYLGGENGYEDRVAHPFPELLLLDLKMPRMDGFDVLRWLQQQKNLRRLPVTVLSSSNHPRDVNQAYDLGANSYLVKPNMSERMIEVVGRIRAYWLDTNQGPDCRDCAY